MVIDTLRAVAELKRTYPPEAIRAHVISGATGVDDVLSTSAPGAPSSALLSTSAILVRGTSVPPPWSLGTPWASAAMR